MKFATEITPSLCLKNYQDKESKTTVETSKGTEVSQKVAERRCLKKMKRNWLQITGEVFNRCSLKVFDNMILLFVEA